MKWVEGQQFRCQCIVGNISDITVSIELHPAPAFMLFKDVHALAEHGLCFNARVRAWCAADIHNRYTNLLLNTSHKRGCLDLPAQTFVSQIGPEGMKSSIKMCHRGKSFAFSIIWSPTRCT